MIKKIRSYFTESLPNGIIYLKKSAVAKNATALYIIQIAEYIIPLITIPYVVRVIGPYGFGESSFCLGLIGYFSLLVDYGFSMSATRSISVHRNDKKAVNKIFSTTIVSKLLLSIFGLVILLLISFISPKIHPYLPLMLAAYLGIIGNAILPLWLFQGMEDMSFLSIADILAKTLMVVGIFIFIKDQNDIIVYLLLISIAQVLYGLIAFLKSLKKFEITFQKVTLFDVKKSLREGWVLFISTASVSFYTAGNPFILGFFVSPTIVGYYSGAEKITKATLGLISPISQAVYPRFSRLVNDSKELFFSWAKKILFIMGGFGLIISFLVFIFAPLAVKIVLGPNFEPAITLIRVLSPLPFIISLSTVFGTQIMLPLGKDKDFTKILFIAGIINFVLVFLLAPRVGALASAIALLCAEVYVTVIMFIYVNYKIRKQVN